MGLLIILGVLIILFIIAIISPHTAGKIKRRSHQKVSRLKRLSNWLWDPLAWWAKTSLNFTRKSVSKTVALGKNLRRKLPF